MKIPDGMIRVWLVETRVGENVFIIAMHKTRDEAIEYATNIGENGLNEPDTVQFVKMGGDPAADLELVVHPIDVPYGGEEIDHEEKSC